MPQAIPFRKDSARRTLLITSQTVSVCADDPASDGAVTQPLHALSIIASGGGLPHFYSGQNVFLTFY